MTMNDFLLYLEIRYYSNLPGTAKLIIKYHFFLLDELGTC